MNRNKSVLDTVIHLAGGSQKLAEMLGLQVSTIYSFTTKGITPVGVLLIESSRWLSRLFDREVLLEKYESGYIDNFLNHQAYKAAREKQIKFDSDIDNIADTPIKHILDSILIQY